jgi:DNA-binding XRE family transcriptional regulator
MNRYQRFKTEALKDHEVRESFEDGFEQLSISAQIAALREQLGYSQQELAKKAHTTQTVISKLETGKNVNLKTLYKVLAALGASIQIKNPTSN